MRSTLPVHSNKPEMLSTAEFTPHNYQTEAIIHLLENPAAGLFLSPGLGKTAITLQAIRLLLANGVINRVLVLAPLRVIYNVWPREIQKWANFNHLTYCVLHGPKKRNALKEDFDIYLCNPEGMAWLSETDTLWDKVDMLVVDESSMWRNPASARFRMLKPRLPYFKRRVILTGTPVPNGYMQLWSQMYILDGGDRLSPTITRYRRRFFDFEFKFSHTEWTLRKGADREIQKCIGDIVIHRSNDELDLPPLTYNYIRVPLPQNSRSIYEQLIKELAVMLNTGAQIWAANSGVLVNKLRQITSGAVYGSVKGEVAHLHSSKIEALKELIEEQQGAPLLVFYQFVHEVDRMKEAYDAPVLGGRTSQKEAGKIIEDWNNDRLPVLYLHPASAGHGLNLQEGGCRAACWFNTTWDLEHYEQAIARIYRQGQTSHVVLHHLVADDTIDEKVLVTLRNKGNVQRALMEYLKR